jgi:hypothetical protein
MKLREAHIEQIKAAAERIGDYGKVTLILSGDVIDVVTEERKRIQNGKPIKPLINKEEE